MMNELDNQLDLFDVHGDLTTTQRRLLNRTIKLLATMPVHFAIVEPDGTQHVQGEWELVRKSRKKKQDRKYPYGAVRNHIRGYMHDLEIGEIVNIPIAQFDLNSIQGGVGSYANSMWGSGSAITARTDDRNYIEVMRVG